MAGCAFRCDPPRSDIAFEDGWVHAPTEPGLGYEIDWDRLKREHTATVE